MVHLALSNVNNNAEDKHLVILRGPTIYCLKINGAIIIIVAIVDHGTGGTAMTGTIVEVIETAEIDANPKVFRSRVRLRALQKIGKLLLHNSLRSRVRLRALQKDRK